jgi:hypothetical protein
LDQPARKGRTVQRRRRSSPLPPQRAIRRWASTVLKEYLLKGFAMDNERLKNPIGRSDYFNNKMLARIREIRASEKRFCQ